MFVCGEFEHHTYEAPCYSCVQAIEDGNIVKVQEWLASLGEESVNSFADEQDILYLSGDSEVKSKGMTALHYAAFYSKVEIVKLLLEKGAGTYSFIYAPNSG